MSKLFIKLLLDKYVFITSDREYLSKPIANARRLQLALELNSHGYHVLYRVKGKYGSVLEDSFCIKIKSKQDISKLVAIANSFDQESILVLDRGKGSLYYCNNKVQEIGNLKEVNKDQALVSPAYSCIVKEGKEHYFIV